MERKTARDLECSIERGRELDSDQASRLFFFVEETQGKEGERSMIRSRVSALVLVLIAAASYGVLSTMIKLAYADGWSGGQVTTAQLTIGALLMWAVVLAVPGAWSKPWKEPWLLLAGIGMLGLALSTILYNMALTQLDASMAIVLLFQFTWMTVMMDAIAGRRLPKPGRLIAVLIIMVGTWLSVNGPAADWSGLSISGLLCGLGSALTYALFLFGTGRVDSKMHPLMKAAIMLTAALPLLYIVFPPGQLMASGAGIGRLLLWGLLLGLIGQVIPTVGYMIGIPKLGSPLVATLASMELPVAVVSAYFLLQETVQGVQWFGILFILTGIVIAERMASS